jgi:hypothetical protein
MVVDPAVVYCGAIVPGYSHSQQCISELAAQGSPAQRVISPAVAPCVKPSLSGGFAYHDAQEKANGR